MKAIAKRLTYANVMSSIAVFLVVAGGTAFAASQLGKNSVGTKQLKKNAVTTAKIKKNAINGAKIKKDAITTAKVKNGAITGAKVNLGTLGTVPSAASLAGFDRTGIVRLNATPGASEAAALAAAPETTLYSAGPLTLYAKCTVSGTDVEGWIFVKTSVNGVVFDSDYDDADGDPTYLNTNTPEDEREVLNQSAGPNSASIYGTHTPGFQGLSPDGTSAYGWNIIAVKQGTIPGGDGIYGPGNVCLFSGELTALNL